MSIIRFHEIVLQFSYWLGIHTYKVSRKKTLFLDLKKSISPNCGYPFEFGFGVVLCSILLCSGPTFTFNNK